MCGESQQGTTGSSGTERGRWATLPLGVASTVSLWEAGHQAPILCRMGACPDWTPCDNAAFGTSSPKDHVVTLTPVGGLPCAPGPRLKAPHRTRPAPRGRTRSALQMKRPRLRSQTGIRKRRRVDRGPRTADALPGALRRTRGGRAPRLWCTGHQRSLAVADGRGTGPPSGLQDTAPSPSAELSRSLRRDLPPTHSPSPLSCTLGSSSKSPSDTES